MRPSPQATTHHHPRHSAPGGKAAPALPQPDIIPMEAEYNRLEHEELVEHMSIPGFLRRIPHRFHLQDINRFGDQVGRAAEALQLAYLTTVDRSLGVIRVFPAPLLQRVYELMSRQFGWPQIIDADADGLDDFRRLETLKAHQRVAKHLRSVLEASGNEDVQRCVGVVLQHLDEESEKIAQNAPARVQMAA